jgi:hypothetical protein
VAWSALGLQDVVSSRKPARNGSNRCINAFLEFALVEAEAQPDLSPVWKPQPAKPEKHRFQLSKAKS